MDDEYEIAVFCDDESTRSGMHGGREVKVVTFWRDEDGEWRARPTHTAQQRRDFEDEGTKRGMPRMPGAIRTTSVQWWRKDEYNPPVTQQHVDRDGVVHDRIFREGGTSNKFLLVCSLCKLNEQRRVSRLVPVLDTLLEHGLKRISLMALVARLQSSKTD